MTKHMTGTREEWLAARLGLLEAEKELTRRSDELPRRRQELPWVRVDKEYRFETDETSVSLAGLVRGRSQLLVYFEERLRRPEELDPNGAEANRCVAATAGTLSDRRRSEPIRPAAVGLNPRWAWVECTSWCEPRVSPAVAISPQVGDFLLRSWLLNRYDRHTDRRDRIKLEPTA